MSYETLKSLHLIFLISWFAGLFYLPRLLVYHAEAQEKEASERDILSRQFEKMEALLFNAIMQPAMVLTWLSGTTLIYMAWWDSFGLQAWLHWKLAFVWGITLYHGACWYLIRAFKQGNFIISSQGLRFFNEIATILLVAVVFLVVAKNTVDFGYALLGFFLFALLIMLAVYTVKRLRNKS